MAHRVTLIPGDGTGPELTEATRRVLEATGVEFDWDVQHAGTDVMEQNDGNPLPEHVLESIRQNGIALKGPITTPVGGGFRSVNVGAAQGARPLRPGAPVQELPGRPLALRERRPDRRAREHRGPLRGHRVRGGHRGRGRAARLARRQGLRRHPPRLGHLDQADLRDGHAPDRPVRVRLRAPQRPPQGHGRPQGEHHEVHRRPLPRTSPARSPPRTRTSSSRTASSTTCACSSSSGPRSTTCSCCRTSTATSSPISAPA